nr:unnamed protein product [Callosobruchus analis]
MLKNPALSKIGLILHISACKCSMSSGENSKVRPSTVFACTPCNKVFTNKRTLDNHVVKNHTGSVASVSSKIHECTQCNYKTTVKHLLAGHVLKEHPEFTETLKSKIHECAQCNYKTTIKYLLAEHVLKEHPEFIGTLKSKIHECPQCNYKTAKRYLLPRHILTHSRLRSDICTIFCLYCNAPFKSSYKLSNHILNKHPEHMDSVKVKTHECKRCSYKCLHKSKLDRHMRTRCTDTVITCIHCYMKFKTMQSLNEHIVRSHSKLLASVSCKIYSCTYCQYKTTIKSNIQRHIVKHPDADSSYEETP